MQILHLYISSTPVEKFILDLYTTLSLSLSLSVHRASENDVQCDYTETNTRAKCEYTARTTYKKQKKVKKSEEYKKRYTHFSPIK